MGSAAALIGFFLLLLVFLYRFDRLLVVTLDRLDGHIDRLLLVLVVDRLRFNFDFLLLGSSFDRFVVTSQCRSLLLLVLPEPVSAIRNALLLRISTGNFRFSTGFFITFS